MDDLQPVKCGYILTCMLQNLLPFKGDDKQISSLLLREFLLSRMSCKTQTYVCTFSSPVIFSRFAAVIVDTLLNTSGQSKRMHKCWKSTLIGILKDVGEHKLINVIFKLAGSNTKVF